MMAFDVVIEIEVLMPFALVSARTAQSNAGSDRVHRCNTFSTDEECEDVLHMNGKVLRARRVCISVYFQRPRVVSPIGKN